MPTKIRHAIFPSHLAHSATPAQQVAAGFEYGFDYDINLTDGPCERFLAPVSTRPGSDWFASCVAPEIYSKPKSDGFTAILTSGWHLIKALNQGVGASFPPVTALAGVSRHCDHARFRNLFRKIRQPRCGSAIMLRDQAAHIVPAAYATSQHAALLPDRNGDNLLVNRSSGSPVPLPLMDYPFQPLAIGNAKKPSAYISQLRHKLC